MNDLHPLLDDEKEVSYLMVLHQARRRHYLALLVFLGLYGLYFIGFFDFNTFLICVVIDTLYLAYELTQWKHIFHYSSDNNQLHLHILNIKGDKKEIIVPKEDFKKVKITYTTNSIEIPQLPQKPLSLDKEGFKALLKELK